MIETKDIDRLKMLNIYSQSIMSNPEENITITRVEEF